MILLSVLLSICFASILFLIVYSANTRSISDNYTNEILSIREAKIEKSDSLTCEMGEDDSKIKETHKGNNTQKKKTNDDNEMMDITDVKRF